MNKKPHNANIWIFHPTATPPNLSGLTRSYDFANNIVSNNYKCTIFSSSHLHYSSKNLIKNNSLYRKMCYNNVPFIFINNIAYKNSKILRLMNMVIYYFNLLYVTYKYAKKYGKPDVIIGSSPHPFAPIAAICIAKKHKCQSIVEIRDLWPETFVAYGLINKCNPILKILYAGEKWIYKKADKLIFTMEGGKDYIIEKGWNKENGGPITLNKISHINNGVDLKAFDYNKENYILKDEDLEDTNTFKVIYTGSIRLVNKVEKILDVAKLFKSQPVKFLIWGDGDQLTALRNRAEKEQIDNIYFKGRVDKKYIPYITTKAQINIILGDSLPLYRFGGSMNKIFDYFASGRPTLSTFKVGYSLVEKYTAGIELDNSTSEAIAKAVTYFMNLDKKTYDMYCRNARKAAEDYSFKNLTSTLIDIINRTI